MCKFLIKLTKTVSDHVNESEIIIFAISEEKVREIVKDKFPQWKLDKLEEV